MTSRKRLTEYHSFIRERSSYPTRSEYVRPLAPVCLRTRRPTLKRPGAYDLLCICGHLEMGMKIITTLAAASLFAGGVATADGRSAGLGMFAVAPGFNLGGSLAFYNLASALGVDGSVYGRARTRIKLLILLRRLSFSASP